MWNKQILLTFIFYLSKFIFQMEILSWKFENISVHCRQWFHYVFLDTSWVFLCPNDKQSFPHNANESQSLLLFFILTNLIKVLSASIEKTIQFIHIKYIFSITILKILWVFVLPISKCFFWKICWFSK